MAIISQSPGAQAAETLEYRVLPNGFPVTHYRLQNGLQLYVVENHSAPVFTIQTWFRVGSKEEKLDPRLNATGLAHLFEHMMFRGTQTHPDGEFDTILTRNGVSNENATTWLDRTNYYQSLPKDKLELVISLESDRMVNLVIDQNLLDTERGAVLGEYNMGLDDPDNIAYEKLYDAAFTTHPYRYSTIGTEAEIRRFSKDDADYFYRKYYSPNNAVILVVGDVDPGQTLGLVERYYGGYAAQPIERVPAPVEPQQTIERQVEFTHGQLTQAKLLVGYHTPETRHADQAALWVVQSLLTVGDGSILHSAWVNDGLAVSVSSNLNQFRDPGLWIVSADLQSGKQPEQLLSILDRKLGELQRAVAPKDLERAKNQLLLELYQEWQENSSLASFMGEFIASADDPLYSFELVRTLDRVSAEDVKRVVQQYFAVTNRTVVIGRPR